MFDYSERIEAFRDEKVRLSSEFLEKLFAHRKANRDRLISRLSDHIPGISIGDGNFKPQGSVAVGLIIQTQFSEDEYDIDDGLVMWKEDLVDDNGSELSAEEVRKRVCAALQDDRFAKAPEVHHNCVRVFYKTSDEERHHVDFAIYRKYFAGEELIRELAGAEGWVNSDPTQVNRWINDLVAERNNLTDGWGTQFRHLVQLLKRFCRSRQAWDLPNGMKLTMLVCECQPACLQRIDLAFRELLQRLKNRLYWNKVIKNLAHPDMPELTRTSEDQNVVDLETRIGEALDQLASLDKAAANNADSARTVWNWIFKSDGFFAEFDAERKQEEKRNALLAKAALVGNGARTSPAGILGSVGVSNVSHGFYGDGPVD
jgi:hypothetical protein